MTAAARLPLAAGVVLAMVACSATGPGKPSTASGTTPSAAAEQASSLVGASLAAGDSRVLLQPLDASAGAAPTAPPADRFDADNPDHLLARCRDREARREWFDAVGDCRRAASLAPDRVEPHAELMRLLVSLQSWSDAEASARKVLSLRPGDPVALYYLAWSLRGQDRYAEAIDALQLAIRAEPSRAEFVQALGRTQCLADDFGAGIATLEKAAAMQPGNAEAARAVASAKAMLDDKLAPYRRLVAEQPASFDRRAALAFLLQKHGLPQQALAEYDTALAGLGATALAEGSELRRLAAQVQYNRGVVYRRLGRSGQAEPALVEAMRLDPGLSAQAWFTIGLARTDEGKAAAAVEALRRSVELAPAVPENRRALADALLQAGKPDEAEAERAKADSLAHSADSSSTTH